MAQAVISRTELQSLIDAAVAQCQNCIGVELNRIYMHEPDELGCNWMVETGSAANHLGCMEEMTPRIHHLRLHYNLTAPTEEPTSGLA